MMIRLEIKEYNNISTKKLVLQAKKYTNLLITIY